jgi:hypothetical protein
VTDEQVVTLRAFLVFDPVYERLTRELAGTGRWQGFSELVVSAFVAAAQRRFAPAWTSAQIVRFTAGLGVLLDALAAALEANPAAVGGGRLGCARRMRCCGSRTRGSLSGC